MPEALIFDAIRTPRGRGRHDGALHEVRPVSLLAGVLCDLQRRNPFDSAQVEDIIIGCATPVGEQGACIAKTAALAAGWDWMPAGLQVGRLAASGLEAVNLAAQKVRSGWEDLVVAGGVESVSRVPPGTDGGAWVLDSQSSRNANFIPAGIAADLVATLDGYSRTQLDEYACASQQRTAAAEAAHRFAHSRVPVVDVTGMAVLTQDELPRSNVTMALLATLKASWRHAGEMGFDAVALARYPGLTSIEHVHTAGNSSGPVDGAAVLLIGSAAKGAALGLVPRARIAAAALGGADPTLMLTGAVVAARKALLKANLRADQIDVYEVDETFAALALRFMQKLDVPHDKVNVNGGAIALGDALGASGAMMIGTLLDELEARGLRHGMVCMGAGPGMGIATIVERL